MSCVYFYSFKISPIFIDIHERIAKVFMNIFVKQLNEITDYNHAVSYIYEYFKNASK